jgi:membrane-associated phospholipid phosphatase
MDPRQLVETARVDADAARQELARRARDLIAGRYYLAVLFSAVGFAVLALLARTVLYFPIDLELTRAIQDASPAWLDVPLGAITWIGFPPQSNVIFGIIILGLFLIGRRLEAAMLAFAAVGSAALWYAVNPLIDRPRPSPELVEVAIQIPTGSFPSGHVVNLTAIFGFLIYLTLLLVFDPWVRRGVVTVLALVIVTIGFARIEDGAHWPSDVLGGYMLGWLWLALTIYLYHQGQHWVAARRGHGVKHAVRKAASKRPAGALSSTG